MHFTIDLGKNVISGMIGGAVTAAIVLAILGAITALLSSFTFGGGGDILGGLLKSSLIVIPAGAIIGGFTAGFGLPWWGSCLVVIGAFLALLLIVNFGKRLIQPPRNY